MIDVSKFVETLNSKPVAVFGLGVSNLAAIKALTKAGASIIAWDDNEECRGKVDVPLKDLAQEDFSNYACLVLAPGVKPEHPVVQKAREAGIEVMCDLEILHRCNHGRKVIGITGTNGKSTTTALIGHILKAPIGGNIGTAALDLDIEEASAIVLEISSFQADLCPTFAPDIAVHLNLSSDHIDHHGTMENYSAAKMKLFRGAGDAIIGVDDDASQRIYEAVKETGERKCFPISADDDIVASLDISALPGAHNRQNAAAAFAVAKIMGLKPETIMAEIKTFPGLKHRQYLVRTTGGAAYINDSKATNADAAGRALACYSDIYWIAGGRAKTGGLKGLEPYTKSIRHAFLIGEAMNDFSMWLDNQGVKHTECGTLDKAVTAAAQMADAGSTILLSPACASFDQFKNFEERGDVFTALVNNLKDEAA